MSKRRFYSDRHLEQMHRLDNLILFIEEARDEIDQFVEPALRDSHSEAATKRWLDPLHEAIDELELEAFNIDSRIRGEISTR